MGKYKGLIVSVLIILVVMTAVFRIGKLRSVVMGGSGA